MTGRIVVYDSHEDAPLAITAKRWIWKPFRWIVAASFRSLENTVAKRLAGIVAATSKISERFLEINSNVEIINNFPIHREFLGINAQDRQTDEKKICYIGALSEGRGIFEMVSAMENIDATLILAGKFDTPELEKKVKDLKGWQKVDFRGYVGRAEIRTILSECTIGFLLLHPEPNYVESQPIKLFEYMMAGVAVVASDFSYWKDHLINDKLACFVDPTNLTQIVSVVNDLLKDDHARINMVGLSRRWAAERFSWETESKKLVEFYKKIVNAYS